MSVHQEVLKSMQEMAAQFSGMGIALQLPPNSTKTMGTEYVEIEMGKMLTAKFLFNSQFMNPIQMFQGGLICAAFDEVFGPLTYMSAGRPVVTLEMSTSFVRPFTTKDEFITIKAEVVSKTKTVILLRAEAKTKEGKLVATATNHSLIMSDANLNKK